MKILISLSTIIRKFALRDRECTRSKSDSYNVFKYRTRTTPAVVMIDNLIDTVVRELNNAASNVRVDKSPRTFHHRLQTMPWNNTGTIPSSVFGNDKKDELILIQARLEIVRLDFHDNS